MNEVLRSDYSERVTPRLIHNLFNLGIISSKAFEALDQNLAGVSSISSITLNVS